MCMHMNMYVFILKYIYIDVFILGWPKSLFRFFNNILWKNPLEFLTNRIYINTYIYIFKYIFSINVAQENQSIS